MDSFIFWRALGVVTLALSLSCGGGYWIYVAMKKTNPHLRYKIKYKIFRRKHNEEDVASLLEDIENGVSEEEMYKALILSNKASPEKANELLYIFKELKKLQMKGGNTNE